MSKPAKKEILFVQTFSVSEDDIKRTRGEIVEYKKHRAAADWGIAVANQKGWTAFDEEGYKLFELYLYALTPKELGDLIRDAKFSVWKRLSWIGSLTDAQLELKYGQMTDEQREGFRKCWLEVSSAITEAIAP